MAETTVTTTTPALDAPVDPAVIAPPPAGTTETTTQTVRTTSMQPSEYEEIKTGAKRWGSAMLGLVATSFVLLIVLVILVAIITAKTDPLPDQTFRSFEWINYQGNGWDKMQAGNMQFSLWPDGTAAVINLATGERVNPAADSTTAQAGTFGEHLTFDGTSLQIYANGGSAIAKASPDFEACTAITLNIMPDGQLFFKCSNLGLIQPVTWTAVQAS